MSDSMLLVLMLAVFLGVELIARVPSTLHTPLMSGSNAISGITIIGAILAVQTAPQGGTLSLVLGVCALFAATVNVVGGYVVTDRMLRMFSKKGRRP